MTLFYQWQPAMESEAYVGLVAMLTLLITLSQKELFVAHSSEHRDIFDRASRVVIAPFLMVFILIIVLNIYALVQQFQNAAG